LKKSYLKSIFKNCNSQRSKLCQNGFFPDIATGYSKIMPRQTKIMLGEAKIMVGEPLKMVGEPLKMVGEPLKMVGEPLKMKRGG